MHRWITAAKHVPAVYRSQRVPAERASDSSTAAALGDPLKPVLPCVRWLHMLMPRWQIDVNRIASSHLSIDERNAHDPGLEGQIPATIAIHTRPSCAGGIGSMPSPAPAQAAALLLPIRISQRSRASRVRYRPAVREGCSVPISPCSASGSPSNAQTSTIVVPRNQGALSSSVGRETRGTGKLAPAASATMPNRAQIA